MKKQKVITTFVVFILVFLFINLVSDKLYFRLDFTQDQRYTLSDATKKVLKSFDGVITVTAYFSEDLPAQLLTTRKDFEDMLIEYEKQSNGNLVYKFENPNQDEGKEAEIQQKGIGPVMINVTENDRVEQIRAYLGATLQMDDRTEIIPIVQPGSAMEYTLTTSVKKLSIKNKPKVAFITGNKEASMATMPQLKQQLDILYDVATYEIGTEIAIPNTFKALIWVSPLDTIPPNHFDQLTTYLNSGGKIFLAYTNVIGDLQKGNLSAAPDIGITKWCNDLGIVLGNNFVTDANCATVTVRQQQGYFTINSQVEFPYFPRINKYSDHAITKGLEEVTFTFVNSVQPTATSDSSIQYSALLYTSENSGVEVPPTFMNVQRKWNQADFTMGEQILALAASGFGNGLGKMIVIGNGAFFINGEAQQVRQLPSDHVNLASNAIDWLADDTGLIELRTKGIDSRPLEKIEDSTRNILKYANVFVPILLLLLYALFRKMKNQRKRAKWSQGNYE